MLSLLLSLSLYIYKQIPIYIYIYIYIYTYIRTSPQVPHILPCLAFSAHALPLFITLRQVLPPAFCLHFPTKIGYGELNSTISKYDSYEANVYPVPVYPVRIPLELRHPCDDPACPDQDLSKGGAVETGCSGSHYIIGCCITYTTPIHCTPLRLHPPLMNTHPTPTRCCQRKVGSLRPFRNLGPHEPTPTTPCLINLHWIY